MAKSNKQVVAKVEKNGMEKKRGTGVDTAESPIWYSYYWPATGEYNSRKASSLTAAQMAIPEGTTAVVSWEGKLCSTTLLRKSLKKSDVEDAINKHYEEEEAKKEAEKKEKEEKEKEEKKKGEVAKAEKKEKQKKDKEDRQIEEKRIVRGGKRPADVAEGKTAKRSKGEDKDDVGNLSELERELNEKKKDVADSQRKIEGIDLERVAKTREASAQREKIEQQKRQLETLQSARRAAAKKDEEEVKQIDEKKKLEAENRKKIIEEEIKKKEERQQRERALQESEKAMAESLKKLKKREENLKGREANVAQREKEIAETKSKAEAELKKRVEEATKKVTDEMTEMKKKWMKEKEEMKNEVNGMKNEIEEMKKRGGGECEQKEVPGPSGAVDQAVLHPEPPKDEKEKKEVARNGFLHKYKQLYGEN